MGGPDAQQFLSFCPGPLLTRNPSSEEWKWAESLVAEYFRQDFARRFGPPYLVLGQLDYLTQLTGRKTIDSILTRMAQNFRNELAKVPLRKDIRSNRPGGSLRPDVLGIAVTTGGIVIELVEVTTFGQAATTLVEDVENKLRALNEKVLTEDISVLESDYYQRSGARTVLSVGPSHWRPRWDQMVFPLPPVSGGAANDNAILEWICYWPTYRFNPSGAPNSAGVDGLILYEIHRVRQPSLVPKEVLDRLREEVRRKEAQRRLANRPLTLTPWVTEDYWQTNKGDKDALLLVAGIGGIALLGLLAWALWPVVAATAVGALPEGGLAALIGTAGEASITAETVGAATTVTARTMSISAQVMQSLGRPIIFGPAAAF